MKASNGSVPDGWSSPLLMQQITVSLDGSETLLANLTLPAEPPSVTINGLLTDLTYSIRAAAWTSMGLGPFSSAVVHRMRVWTSAKSLDPQSPPAPASAGDAVPTDADATHEVTSDATLVVQETWFILLLGGILVAILFLLVAALIVRRQLAKKKAMSTINKSNAIDAIEQPVKLLETFFFDRCIETC